MPSQSANYKISEKSLMEVAKMRDLRKEATYQELLDVSDEVLEKYYDVARFFLDNTRFEDASAAFTFLLFLNSKIHCFWLGLGVAEQSLKHFEEAGIAYAMAQMIDPNNPIAFASGSQCSAAVGDMVYAGFCKMKALELCGDREEFAALKQALSKINVEEKT